MDVDIFIMNRLAKGIPSHFMPYTEGLAECSARSEGIQKLCFMDLLAQDKYRLQPFQTLYSRISAYA